MAVVEIEQTLSSIREGFARDREEELADPKNYRSGLPNGDPRLVWDLDISGGHPVLSLRSRAFETDLIGFIEPRNLIWGGVIFLDGERVDLKVPRPQPNKFHMALHLYKLAVELLDSEEAAHA